MKYPTVLQDHDIKRDCDICYNPAIYDGKLRILGGYTWGYMCKACWESHGVK